MEFSFDPYPSYYTIILPGLVVLAIIMVFNELKGERRRVIRVVVSILVFISALILALRPSTKKLLDPDSIILLTENYDKEITDGLKASLSNFRLIDLSAPGQSLNNALRNNSIKEIYLSGDGLDYYQIKNLNLPVTYIPSNAPKGIIDIRYESQISKGKLRQVEVVTRMDQEGLLVVERPSNESDTIQVERGENSLLITEVALIEGNFLDYLFLYDSANNLIDKGIIPYEVKQPKPITVLFLMGYPNFETRFIKNWLAENNHKVAVRYKVSKDKFIMETINLENQATNLADPKWLSSVDLIISDRYGWDDLGSLLRNRIMERVKSQGLGILFIPSSESDISNSSISRIINKESFANNSNPRAEFTLLESGVKFILPKMEVTSGSDPFTFPIYSDSKGSIISFGTFNGLGRIGFSLVGNTFSLVLNGFKDTYSNYWSEVINRLSKNWNKDVVKIENEQINRVGNPVNLKFTSKLENPNLMIDSIKLGIRQSPYFDDTWSATFWPQRDGWHSIEVADTLAGYLFVYPDEFMVNVERETKRSLNEINFNKGPATSIVHLVSKYQAVPFWSILAILVACLGFLWLEPRL